MGADPPYVLDTVYEASTPTSRYGAGTGAAGRPGAIERGRAAILGGHKPAAWRCNGAVRPADGVVRGRKAVVRHHNSIGSRHNASAPHYNAAVCRHDASVSRYNALVSRYNEAKWRCRRCRRAPGCVATLCRSAGYGISPHVAAWGRAVSPKPPEGVDRAPARFRCGSWFERIARGCYGDISGAGSAAACGAVADSTRAISSGVRP